jgi:hypothetical protein
MLEKTSAGNPSIYLKGRNTDTSLISPGRISVGATWPESRKTSVSFIDNIESILLVHNARSATVYEVKKRSTPAIKIAGIKSITLCSDNDDPNPRKTANIIAITRTRGTQTIFSAMSDAIAS